jgi:PTH1 family peptidyl-tRNA hydrolase
MTALELLLAGDMDKAMARVHAKPARPKPPRPADLRSTAPAAGAPAAMPPEASSE